MWGKAAMTRAVHQGVEAGAHRQQGWRVRLRVGGHGRCRDAQCSEPLLPYPHTVQAAQAL